MNDIYAMLSKLDKRITLLEAFVLNSQKRGFSKYDLILDDYLETTVVSDFMYVETTEAYKKYKEYRVDKAKDDKSLCASIRYFNTRVKAKYPMIDIKHITRGTINLYRWEPKEGI